MRIAAPADKRFRRAQVSPAKRRPWRRSRAVVAVAATVVALGLYVLYRAADFVLAAEALTVSRITVSGNDRMSRGEVLAALAGVRGASLVTIDLEAWRRKLLQSPWVGDAAIRRVLPGTLAVAISERQPMAIARIEGRLYLVDRDGTIIDEFGPNYAEFDLPIVDGLAASPRGGGPLIDDARAGLAGRLLTELQRKPAVAALVSQIDVTDVRGASVILDGDTALVRIGDDRFVERIESYLELRDALRERVPDIDYVDLRFDERVYVRPQGGKSGS
jgi:cell division septal protein FtsQ